MRDCDLTGKSKDSEFLADVMLVSPSWTTYAPQCRLAGHEPIIVETSFESEWKVGPEALESAVKRPGLQSNKLLVLNNPGNPCESTDSQHKVSDSRKTYAATNEYS